MKRLCVLHCADLHVGKNRKYDDYLLQQQYMLEAIINQVRNALQEAYDSVWLVVAGDLVDRNQDTRRSEFVLLLTHFFRSVIALRSEHGARFTCFMIDGNHDRQPSEAEPSVLTPLAFIMPEGVNLQVREPKWYPEERVLSVPFGGYDSETFKNIFDQYPANFVIGHECLARMQTDTGYSPPRDQDKYIEIDEVLKESRVAAVFLGDIHKCQSLDANKLCWYSGSPITHDFSHRLPKGVLRHTFILEDGWWVRDVAPVLIPLGDPRIRYHFQLGRIDREAKIPWEKLYQYESCYLDVTVTAEIFKLIEAKINGFFSCPYVSWDFERQEEVVSEQETVGDEIDLSFYVKAVRDWAADNLEHLPADLVVEFYKRVDREFEGRG